MDSRVQKSVLVTGAGQGIGAAVARIFSENHYHVILVGRKENKLQSVAEELSFSSSVLPCDLTQKQEVQTLASQLKEIVHAYPLKTLVNNAAILLRSSVENAHKDWETLFQFNVLATIYLTEQLLPFLKEAAPSAIVNISSTAAFRPIVGMSAYSGLKRALNHWTESLALELAPYKMRVNSVCPGIIDTPIHEWKDQEKKEVAQIIPLKQIGEPKDIAEAVYFLASEKSKWTTGTYLSVDGGLSLQ